MAAGDSRRLHFPLEVVAPAVVAPVVVAPVVVAQNRHHKIRLEVECCVGHRRHVDELWWLFSRNL